MIRGYVNDIERARNPSNRPKTIEGLKEQDENRATDFVEQNYGETSPGPDYEQRKAELEQANADYNTKTNTPSTAQSEASIKSSTTEGRLYLVAVDTLDRLDIQFVPDLDITRQPNIASLQIIGQNTPTYHYISGETNLALKLDFHAMEENRMDVINKCRWLEHLAFNDKSNRPAQKVKLIFGDLFRDELWVVKTCKYKLNNFHRPSGYLPQQAYVDLTLSLDVDDNLGWDEVRSDNNNSHLGIARG